jgi:succinate-semialdehyde dehydrogenase/glutarate-semialdehyde dehydrogenase
MPLATINPTTGGTLRIFDELSDRELEAKLDRAARAFRVHRRSTFAERAVHLRHAAEIFEAEQDRLAGLMALEMGKPLTQGRAEAVKSAAGCRYYAEHGERLLADEPLADGDATSFVRYEPIGPVLAVMPWNYPFWQVVRFAAPALMAGNVVLLKHADNVPQCGEALDDLFRRAGFAEGCLQYLSIPVAKVEGVIDDPRVAGVTLTGSLTAGRAVAGAAGRQVKRTVLELGGSDPFLVMPSADWEKVVREGVKSRTQNAGQSCIAVKRFILHDEIYDRFVERMVAAFRNLRVGDPFVPDTEMGPLAHARGREALERQVGEAVKAGAKILTGGNRLPGPGYFYEPTVLAGLPREAAVYREEIFGPVALLFRAGNLDEALAIANDTPFGLGASVWTRDEAEQQRAISELETGQVFINEMTASRPELPFGGAKLSGYGRELGAPGPQGFMNAKTVRIGKS